MRNHALCTLLLLLALPTVARADAVGPQDPAVECPPGSRVELNHCGTVCVPSGCSADATCRRPGDVCQRVDLCVEDEPYCGGWTNDPYERVRGTCDEGCGSYECRSLSVCAPPPSTGTDSGPAADAGDSAVVTYGCGCRLGDRRGNGWAGAFALVGLVVLIRRQR